MGAPARPSVSNPKRSAECATAPFAIPGVLTGAAAELVAHAHGLHTSIVRASRSGGESTVAIAPGLCCALYRGTWLAATGCAAPVLAEFAMPMNVRSRTKVPVVDLRWGAS